MKPGLISFNSFFQNMQLSYILAIQHQVKIDDIEIMLPASIRIVTRSCYTSYVFKCMIHIADQNKKTAFSPGGNTNS